MSSVGFFNIEKTLTCLNTFVLLLNVKLNSVLAHVCVQNKSSNIMYICILLGNDIVHNDKHIRVIKTHLSSIFYVILLYFTDKKKTKDSNRSPLPLMFWRRNTMNGTCQLFVTLLFHRLIYTCMLNILTSWLWEQIVCIIPDWFMLVLSVKYLKTINFAVKINAFSLFCFQYRLS